VEDELSTLSMIYRPLIPIIKRSPVEQTSTEERPATRSFVNPLRLFTYPDVILLLIFIGVNFAVYTCITATISTLFKETYPSLSDSEIGLCFLASGGGMIIGSTIVGKFLDRDYRAIKNQMIAKAQADQVAPENVMNEESFPIEKARLRTLPLYVAIYAGSTIGYGWCLQSKVHIAGPLILLVISKHST
jgi:hypothetical protein